MASPPRLQGRVVGAHGRHYIVETDDGRLRKCFPRGKKALASVGDFVSITPQGQDEGAVESIHDRRNLLYRSDDMRSKQFAANVDRLFIVIAPEPVFSEDLLGRALVAAGSVDIEPVIVLNKTDLPAPLVQGARLRLSKLVPIDVPVLETSALSSERTRDALLPWLAGRTSLLLGQSGMGKSTLLNLLVPEAQAATQAHSQALGTGRHTTTSTRLYHLPDGSGDIIDSPGFQSFGLQHLSPAEIEHGFPEFADAIRHCRFYNCTHRHEPGCGVLSALEQGRINADRHDLYCRLLAENEAKPRY